MKQLKNDPRVIKMAKCLLFAVNNFRNGMVLNEDNSATTWHKWFKEALTEAGYVVTEPVTASATGMSKKRSKRSD